MHSWHSYERKAATATAASECEGCGERKHLPENKTSSCDRQRVYFSMATKTGIPREEAPALMAREQHEPHGNIVSLEVVPHATESA